MANFNTAIDTVLKHEGGYSNRATDTGGETYRGISRKHNPQWIGWSAVDAAKRANGGSLPNNYIINSPTFESQIKQFYKTTYWDAIGGDKIKDQAVAEIIFDTNVNGGVTKVVSDSLGTKVSLPFINDVNKINEENPEKLFAKIKSNREAYYKSLNQPANINGWLKRLSSFQYYKENPKVAIVAIIIIGGLTALALYFIHRKK